MQSLSVIGNLGADAEVRESNGQKFISFKVADTSKFTNQKGETQETTTWISCAWNSDGGNLLQYLKQGVKVYVSGRPSYRVYSSQKLRCMVAGVELHVQNIELCGGSSDEVPRELASPDGVIYKPQKFYWIEQPKGNPVNILFSTRGGAQFDVDKKGFITKHIEDEQKG